MQTALRIASDAAVKAMPKKLNFNVASVNGVTCPPGKDRVWVYDSREPGLALMVTSAGSRAFYLYRRVHGAPQRVRLGGFPDISIEQARKLAQRTRGDIASGIDPQAARRDARVRGASLGDAWAWFLDNHAKLKKRSWRVDEIRYGQHLKPWENRRLSEIKKSDVAALYTRVAKATSWATANRVLSLLSVIYKEFSGARDGELENPVRGVKRQKEHSRERFLSADELQRFFAQVEKIDPDWRDFFSLCLLTGARRSNVLSMRWDELDLSRREWRIPGEKFKNGRATTVVLAQAAVDAIEKRKGNGSDYVFPDSHRRSSTGHRMRPDRAWGDLCKAAKLPGVRIHDLRRTLGSWQAANGANLAVIGKSLGHKTMQATAIYARLDLAPVKASVDAATAAMLAVKNLPAEVRP